jgi:hypothetical protein
MTAADIPLLISQCAADADIGGLLRLCELTLADGRLFKKATHIYVFERGCVLGHHKTDRVDHFRWDEVERFTQRMVRKLVNGRWKSTTFAYGFELPGRTIRLIGVTTALQRSGLEGFVELVDPLVTVAQIPAMTVALERGESVRFGAFFRVAPEGLHQPALFKKNQHLPWADLKEVTVEHGRVVVYSRNKRRKWGSASTDMVPNLRAFMTLAHSAAKRVAPTT